jgi:hypothetical protein
MATAKDESEKRAAAEATLGSRNTSLSFQAAASTFRRTDDCSGATLHWANRTRLKSQNFFGQSMAHPGEVGKKLEGSCATSRHHLA